MDVKDLIVVVGLNLGLLVQMIVLNKLERLVVEVVVSVRVLVHHHVRVRQIVIVTVVNLVVVTPHHPFARKVVVLVQNQNRVYVIVKVIVVVVPQQQDIAVTVKKDVVDLERNSWPYYNERIHVLLVDKRRFYFYIQL